MPENDPLDDIVAAARAQSDQQRAAVQEFANVLVTFRRACVEGGFSETTADNMGAAYFSVLLGVMARA